MKVFSIGCPEGALEIIRSIDAARIPDEVADIRFIVHDAPALRGESNYVARIDLAPFGFADLFEQVWLSRKGDKVFGMCCIPFRAYGISLNDVVRTSEDGSLVVEVVEQSRRRVLRALFMLEAGSDSICQAVEEISSRVDDVGLLCEWSGDRHVAIDVPPGTEVNELLKFVDKGERSGLLRWEWADVMPFSR